MGSFQKAKAYTVEIEILDCIDLPLGLTIDESNGDIYICGYYNNRIQILSKEFSFKSQFGKDTLKHPRDVKLSKEYIYVLDASNPCLHLFSYNHILQKSVISRGKGSHSILFFNTEFQFIHKISVSTLGTTPIYETEHKLTY